MTTAVIATTMYKVLERDGRYHGRRLPRLFGVPSLTATVTADYGDMVKVRVEGSEANVSDVCRKAQAWLLSVSHAPVPQPVWRSSKLTVVEPTAPKQRRTRKNAVGE